MILNKIFRHFKESKILDLKYIIIEIALIFAGITLAANYNNYQNQLKDEAFLKETITQIYEELKTDNQINNLYSKSLKEKLNGLNLIQTILLDKKSDLLNSNDVKNSIASLPNTLSLSNSIIGFNRLKDKNLNLVKNKKIRNELINYYDHMNYNIKDISDFNNDILQIKPYIFKYLKNYNFLERTYDTIINLNDFYEDNAFENQIGFINSDLKMYEDILKIGALPKSVSLLKNLEKEYPYLKE